VSRLLSKACRRSTYLASVRIDVIQDQTIDGVLLGHGDVNRITEVIPHDGLGTRRSRQPSHVLEEVGISWELRVRVSNHVRRILTCPEDSGYGEAALFVYPQFFLDKTIDHLVNRRFSLTEGCSNNDTEANNGKGFGISVVRHEPVNNMHVSGRKNVIDTVLCSQVIMPLDDTVFKVSNLHARVHTIGRILRVVSRKGVTVKVVFELAVGACTSLKKEG